MSESNSNSANKPQKKFNKNRRRKNYKNSGNKNSANPNSNKNSNNNRNRRPKSLTATRVLQKYDNLMEQYIIARKKYYEMHARATGKQLAKIENNYASTLKALRDFEVKLEDWQKEALDKKINSFKADRQFTSSHDLVPEGDQVSFVGEFEDPHLLPTQKATEWSKDTEESSGSIDDYQKYKDSKF